MSRLSDTEIFIDLSTECVHQLTNATGLAYLWESDPVRKMLGAPIYSADEFRLPAAPWKHQLGRQKKNFMTSGKRRFNAAWSLILVVGIWSLIKL